MNKRGLSVVVYFMIGVLFLILALALSAPLQEVVNGDDVMGSNGLDCSNESISNQDKANCQGIDIISPIYIAVLFGLGTMLIGRILI